MKRSTKRVSNIFVLGYDEDHDGDIRALPDIEQFNFYPLLHSSELIYQERFEVEAKLDKARAILRNFNGRIDGIICHWDFPVNPMAAILAEEFGLRYPSLEAILKCSHKYWSRIEQNRVAPEATPKFCAVDPFSPDPLSQVTLDYPFWIKPVTGYSSALGFRIDNETDFDCALGIIRAKIRRIGNEFNNFLKRVKLPPEIQEVNGNWLIAEELVGGHEFAPEGYVQNNVCHVHGVFDMVQAENGKSFQRVEYPSKVSPEVRDHAIDVVTRVMKQVGFNNGCFNVELFWDPVQDRLSIIEVNARISQSHSYQFEQVDGMSNHEVAVHVATGDEPLFEHGKGIYQHAAKFFLRRYEMSDGVAFRVPSSYDLKKLRVAQPDTRAVIKVRQGERLSQLVDQDAYSYVIAELMVAARSVSELEAKYQQAVDMLPFEFGPASGVESHSLPRDIYNRPGRLPPIAC